MRPNEGELSRGSSVRWSEAFEEGVVVGWCGLGEESAGKGAVVGSKNTSIKNSSRNGTGSQTNSVWLEGRRRIAW